MAKKRIKRTKKVTKPKPAQEEAVQATDAPPEPEGSPAPPEPSEAPEPPEQAPGRSDSEAVPVQVVSFKTAPGSRRIETDLKRHDHNGSKCLHTMVELGEWLADNEPDPAEVQVSVHLAEKCGYKV